MAAGTEVQKTQGSDFEGSEAGEEEAEQEEEEEEEYATRLTCHLNTRLVNLSVRGEQ